MPSTTRLLIAACMAAAFTGGHAGAASAAEGASNCARTASALAPATASAGRPCWGDVDPYPFGADGNAVDTSTVACKPPGTQGRGYRGDQASCYLKVDSLAFRSFNRGLAATSPVVGDLNSTTAYGVWLFNGVRWFPDPTFPGGSVCRGDEILWAGKRDYWLVGGRVQNWPQLCRFDGVNFEWQPLDVPATALAHVPLDDAGKVKGGSIRAGTCPAWNDCTFAGSFGVALHWDGTTLTDATPDPADDSLRGAVTAGVTRTGADGHAFGYLVSDTGPNEKGQQVSVRADGSAPPQVFGIGRGPLTPFAFTPPTVPVPNDLYRTDLVAVDANPSGRTWVAGVPVGYRASRTNDPSFFPGANERRTTTAQPSPLVALDADGTPASCSDSSSRSFTWTSRNAQDDSFLWSTVGVFPGAGDAIAGGQEQPRTATGTLNDDGRREPVLALVGCDTPAVTQRFRVPDPFSATPATAALIPADRLGAVTSVALTAANDGWAATTQGTVLNPEDPSQSYVQRPRLYRLSDGQAPAAAPGDDEESRPVVFEADPPIIVEAPPDPEPAPVVASDVVTPGKTVVTTTTLKPAIYGVKSRVRKLKGSKLELRITFKLRRAVIVGAQGLRKGKVVTSSGYKRFKGKSGTLVLKLNRKRYPTRIRFVMPKGSSARIGSAR